MLQTPAGKHFTMTLVNFSFKEQLPLDTPSDSFRNLPEEAILLESQPKLSWIAKMKPFRRVALEIPSVWFD